MTHRGVTGRDFLSMPAAIESSYKARDVEGLLDLFFYRRVGYVLAQIFARLRLTPSIVTLLSGAVGIIAGHLYFYRDLRLNLIGMILHVSANALDNADGQLARLTNQRSRLGRMLDGFCDHLVFLSVYVHLSLRYMAGGGSAWICVLAVAAGFSHSLQSAVADYFRNGYLYFVTGKARAELDSSNVLRASYARISWRREPRKKLFDRFYLNYTMEQEKLAPGLKELVAETSSLFPEAIPGWFTDKYRALAKPLLKWLNVLTTNTRMLCLFALLFLGRPIGIFILELTVFNALLGYVLRRHENICRSLSRLLHREPALV